jgi:ribosomal protein S27E
MPHVSDPCDGVNHSLATPRLASKYFVRFVCAGCDESTEFSDRHAEFTNRCTDCGDAYAEELHAEVMEQAVETLSDLVEWLRERNDLSACTAAFKALWAIREEYETPDNRA